jgi:ferredoxin
VSEKPIAKRYLGGYMSEKTTQEEKEKTLEDIRKEADEKACAVQKIQHFIRKFLSGLMCGKCFPCAFGTCEARIRSERLSGPGQANEADIEILRRIGSLMIYSSRCKKGKDTGKFIIDILTNSEEEIRKHLSGICPQKECIALVEYRINPGLCTMCGKCAVVCKDNAILGDKRTHFQSGYLPFEIRQKRCTKCGECLKVCPENAVEILSLEIKELINT